LRQRVIASYHLGPLDQDETRAYIEHRLKQVGWKGDPEFHDGVFPLVHTSTGGIPRRINTLCTRALLGAFLSEKHVISVQDMEHVIAEFADEFGDDAPAESTTVQMAQDALALEKRLLGVEKAMSATVNLLRQLIRSREPSSREWTKKTS
jgi:general secretion pathway protein A